MKEFKKSLFIFRRDLRIQDNIGLANAAKQSERVIPCFIFDPRQISKANKYRSINAVQFMLTSLQDVDKQLRKEKGKLYLFQGQADKVVAKIIKQNNIDAVFCNRDYTPFSLKRDKLIEKVCRQQQIYFEQLDDVLLQEPNKVKTANGTPYMIFTAFFKRAQHFAVEKPLKLPACKFLTAAVKGEVGKTIYKKILAKQNKEIHVKGGRNEGLKLLRALKKS